MMKKNTLIVVALLIILITVIFMQLNDKNGISQEPVHAAGDESGRKPLPSADALKNLPPDGGPNYNRLVFQKSPYLLQHAANPVDWYPWGEAAFTRAAKEDKPIFLSIGYSTCHWCHVMEHESFEDDSVAALMNEAFVCIKVDREERPDVDQIYMSVCQAMTGSGGWPLNIIMTPDKKPFFAGTYFPKASRQGRMGMMDLVPRVQQLWANDRDKLLESADKVTEFLKQNSGNPPGDRLTEAVLNTTFEQLSSRFDEGHGGFGNAPKFPSPHNFTFLLRYWHRTGEEKALRMVEKTLSEMRRGGIFDQVGFGFHRYSTDRVWLLPHFEKMLYDQALLAMAYIETYQATGDEKYATTAREIFTYVLRDMTSPEGGFYSAEDADSEGEEGLFYLWTPDELKKILGKADAEFVIEMFGVEEGGNFVEQAKQVKTGDSILHLQRNFEEDEKQRWEKIRSKLFESREKRIHPLKDDKILTDWNGLMIAAFAKGAAALDEPAYAKAACNAADFIRKKLTDKKGRLLKRYRQAEASFPAHAEDYAFMIWGLLELYEATFEIKYLQHALDLNELMLAHFWDEKNGGFFFTADSSAELLVRTKEIYDGAIPSANSVAAMNLIRIGRMTADTDFEEKAMDIGRAFADQVRQAPIGNTQLMSALNFAFGPSLEVVIAGKSGGNDTRAMLKALSQEYVPNKVVLFRPTDTEKPAITDLAKFTEYQTDIEGKATAYVCLNYACKAPTTDINEMRRLLRNPRKKD